jgi:hypothetical protein
MNELIKLYNNKYSKIEYPKTKLDFYYVYLFLQNKINEYDDDELRKLFEKIEIPKPTTLKELDVYRECVDFINGIRISKTGNKSVHPLNEGFHKLGFHEVYEENGCLYYYLEGVLN